MIFRFKYTDQKQVLHYRIYRVLWVSFLLLCIHHVFFSCKEFLEIEPPKNELISETVYSNDEDAKAAIRGIYRELKNGFTSGSTSSIPVLAGIYADELKNFSASIDFLGFYNSQLIAENTQIFSNWSNIYKIIYRTNSLLEGLNSSTDITPEVKNLLEGEAKYIRAFCYFYLVNFWGEVPLITNTNFEENRLASRTQITNVYGLIVNDLVDAQELLLEDYTHADGERIRVNKSCSIALLARVFLYMEDWANAEIYASQVIENPLYVLEEDLNSVFQKNSVETIWQLRPINVGHTDEGNLFILTSTPSWVALSNYVVNAFEPKDQRRVYWVEAFTDESSETTWHYAFKYKIKQNFDPNSATEYSTVLRLAEQYLIRAECRARLGKLAGAQKDINIIRNRAGLENTTASTQEELLEAILNERQVELFTEWGHRWLDLKRTGRLNNVIGDIKPAWKPTAQFWPIPQLDIENNPNLSQNMGY